MLLRRLAGSPGPSDFDPPARSPGRLARRGLVLVAGQNPSADYYIRPRLSSDDSWDVIDVAQTPPIRLAPGSFVLICRYVSRAWLACLERSAADLAGVGLFLDDDFTALVDDATVPLRYRLRVLRDGLLPWRRLARLPLVVFVSTPTLAERLAPARPRIIGPVPADLDLKPAPARPAGEPIRVAYHGTAAHGLEHAFLADVARRLAAVRADVLFEVIADAARARIWRDVPGVEVRRPLSWPAYRALAATQSIDIFLAPLAPTPLNAARSPTKAIDAVRFGAAGLFSNMPVYASLAGAAPLLPYDAGIWAEEIVRLACDSEARARLAARLRGTVSAWRQIAEPLALAGLSAASSAAHGSAGVSSARR